MCVPFKLNVMFSQTTDSRGERDWKRAHVMLYVTPLRGISFDVGAFRRDPVRVQKQHHAYDVFPRVYIGQQGQSQSLQAR